MPITRIFSNQNTKQNNSYIAFFLMVVLTVPAYAFSFHQAQTAHALQQNVFSYIHVIDAPAAYTVRVTQAATVLARGVTAQATCQIQNLNSRNLVQDQTEINLNQPANCFSLVSAVFPVFSSLTVQPQQNILYNTTAIVVVNAYIQSPQVMPHVPDSIPATPAPTPVILGLVILFLSGQAVQRLKKVSESAEFYPARTFVVLRC